MLYNLFENRDFVSVFAVALLAEGVDRNSLLPRSPGELGWSPSSQRAWIEISRTDAERWPGGVALLAEGVDRNSSGPLARRFSWYVALLAEGVDRNLHDGEDASSGEASPSSQRAWIEI